MTSGGYTMTEAWNLQLQGRVRQLETAISWALGESPKGIPEFMPPVGNKAPYWWRRQLRALAAVAEAPVSPKARKRRSTP